jgi:hypothetical protein
VQDASAPGDGRSLLRFLMQMAAVSTILDLEETNILLQRKSKCNG